MLVVLTNVVLCYVSYDFSKMDYWYMVFCSRPGARGQGELGLPPHGHVSHELGGQDSWATNHEPSSVHGHNGHKSKSFSHETNADRTTKE